MTQTPSPNDTFFGLDISDIRKSLFAIRRKISKRYLLIEFGVDSLTYGEARIVKDQVVCSKINRIILDKEAIERGSPTDVNAMSSFLNQIIEENQIWATRVAITLPPEASLSKIIYLPENLDYPSAIEYIKNPTSSGFQFPISLDQTDFDIIPLNCIPINKQNKTRAYFLSSVPKKLVNNIIETIANAKLELHALDVAYTSLERLASNSIEKLDSSNVIIVLELCEECSYFYILSIFGPIYVSTLAATRLFNYPQSYDGNLSLEEVTINREDYLEITELDLKVILSEIKNEIAKFKISNDLDIAEILLSGINSSHPGISKIFENRLNIKTTILRALSLDSVMDIGFSKSLCTQDLNRLVGLSLNMIEIEDNFLIYKNSRNPKIKKHNKKDSSNFDVIKNSSVDIASLKKENINSDNLIENKTIQELEEYQLNTNSKENNRKSLEDRDLNQKKQSFEDFLNSETKLSTSNSTPDLVSDAEMQSIDNKDSDQPLLDLRSNLSNSKDTTSQIDEVDSSFSDLQSITENQSFEEYLISNNENQKKENIEFSLDSSKPQNINFNSDIKLSTSTSEFVLNNEIESIDNDNSDQSSLDSISNLSETKNTSKATEGVDNKSFNEVDKFNTLEYSSNDKSNPLPPNEIQSNDNESSAQSLLDFDINENQNDFNNKKELNNNIDSKSKLVEEDETDNTSFKMPDI